MEASKQLHRGTRLMTLDNNKPGSITVEATAENLKSQLEYEKE